MLVPCGTKCPCRLLCGLSGTDCHYRWPSTDTLPCIAHHCPDQALSSFCDHISATQECTYRKVWEDDGNVQRVEVEQSATAFFKTIYTRMHVVQVRPHPSFCRGGGRLCLYIWQDTGSWDAAQDTCSLPTTCNPDGQMLAHKSKVVGWGSQWEAPTDFMYLMRWGAMCRTEQLGRCSSALPSRAC